MRFARNLAIAVIAWHVTYFAWFVVTGDIHAFLTALTGEY